MPIIFLIKKNFFSISDKLKEDVIINVSNRYQDASMIPAVITKIEL